MLDHSRIPVWWDPQIAVGERFTPAIETALRQAAAVVVLWSRNSIRSEWVIREATAGLQLGTLVPVLLDKVTPPGQFAQFDCADLSTWNPRLPHQDFEQLRHALLHVTSAPSQKPAAGWQTRRIDAETIHVVLSREQHTVRCHQNNVYIDGNLVVRGVASPINERSYQFELSDGSQRYFAQLVAIVTLMRGAIKRLTLTVGGSIVYDG